MTTGADGGAAITALLGHPDHRSGYGTTRSGGERCSAGRSYRSQVDRYAVVEVAAVWTTLAQAHKLTSLCWLRGETRWGLA
jgi:hypothetical protein